MRSKLRTAALATVGGLALTAAANRLVAGRVRPLEQPVPGETGTYRWRGIDVAYTEAGDPENPDLVLLHGINAAATSRDFRELVNPLAEDYHVVVPDLPGFGRSERPPLVYSASLYRAFVRDFLEDRAENPAVVASSLVASYAADAAGEVSVSRLVLVCPTATGMGDRRLWLRTLYRTPLLGTAIHNLVVSEPSLEYFSADHGYYDPARREEGKLDYQWQSGHQHGARYAPASFISGYLDPDFDLVDRITGLDAPVTLVWGREAEITPLREGRDLAEATDSRLLVFDYAKLLPHSEYPGEFVDFLREELSGDTAGEGTDTETEVSVGSAPEPETEVEVNTEELDVSIDTDPDAGD